MRPEPQPPPALRLAAQHDELRREFDVSEGHKLAMDSALSALASGQRELAAAFISHEKAQHDRDARQERAIERLTLLSVAPLVMTGTVTGGASPALTITSTLAVVVLALLAPELLMRIVRQRAGLDSQRPPPPAPAQKDPRGEAHP